mmetsp:Transcript_10216/g.34732  ORF Transcript_10216/g.34732 Transcript_10216/m.34732 type:complete len:209 (+) Transcript_10216:1159-1785(+)
MALLGSLPLKKSRRMAWILGIRVEPPTSTTSSTSAFFRSASSRARLTGSRQRLKRSMHSSSKRARVKVSERSMPSAMLSTSMRTECAEESTRLARSTSWRSLDTTWRSPLRSLPCLALITRSTCFTNCVSKSSPPRCVSPAVETTSSTPVSMFRMDTSNVPPPRSKTRTVCTSSLESRPYAMAAAVGSLMMRATSRPAMVPASLVAWR